MKRLPQVRHVLLFVTKGKLSPIVCLDILRMKNECAMGSVRPLDDDLSDFRGYILRLGGLSRGPGRVLEGFGMLRGSLSALDATLLSMSEF